MLCLENEFVLLSWCVHWCAKCSTTNKLLRSLSLTQCQVRPGPSVILNFSRLSRHQITKVKYSQYFHPLQIIFRSRVLFFGWSTPLYRDDSPKKYKMLILGQIENYNFKSTKPIVWIHFQVPTWIVISLDLIDEESGMYFNILLFKFLLRWRFEEGRNSSRLFFDSISMKIRGFLHT